MRRRQFLTQTSLGVASLALPRLHLPPVFDRTRNPALVIVELNGGNDGLNTVVPYADDRYHRARPTLAVAAEQVVRLDDALGLHPALRPLTAAVDEGWVAVVGDVGYAEPNRSHFRSMDIWQSGIVEREDTTSGWLGRALAAAASTRPERTFSPFSIGAGPVPLLFRAAPWPVVALRELTDLRPRGPARPRATSGVTEPRTSAELAFLESSTRHALDMASRLERAASGVTGPRADFPRTPLGRELELAATVLRTGLDHTIVHVRMNGFDSHAAQADSHPQLLDVLGRALAAFVRDLNLAKRLDDVAILVFSEFGRRVQENASRGTDHGAAGPVLLLGGGVTPGVHGGAPDLEDLIDGDLRPRVDFRNVYAQLATHVLGLDAEPVPAAFGNLPDLFRR